MRQGEPAFGHHLGEISKAELVSQIPAHAEHDDLLVKVSALEESVHFVCARQLCRSTDLPTTMLCPSSSHQSPANEEMKSAAEEYQSVNEELQSSNEELETSKEEMQSINEELQTINAEMNAKNDALMRLNSDLKNLLDSTQIATMFLDSALRVNNFTPAITDIF